jgi:GNAT superfamily N-acetyltransferase
LEVTVRSARPGDVARLVALLEAGAIAPGREDAADPDPYERALEEIAATPGCDVLVAEVAGRVVGVCQLVVFRHFQARGGRCAELESVHVEEGWRSRGIGGALVEAAVARAVDLGCYRVQLSSNKQRAGAHRFYERHGFVASHEGFKRPL